MERKNDLNYVHVSLYYKGGRGGGKYVLRRYGMILLTELSGSSCYFRNCEKCEKWPEIRNEKIKRLTIRVRYTYLRRRGEKSVEEKEEKSNCWKGDKDKRECFGKTHSYTYRNSNIKTKLNDEIKWCTREDCEERKIDYEIVYSVLI